ncbi:hypothetical protein HDZ31DRAFT_33635 [Schizophyllum fasciatum]
MAGATGIYHPLNRVQVPILQNAMVRFGVDYVFYGMQGTLFAAAVASLLHREKKTPFILLTITMLFICSTIEVIVGVKYYLLQLPAAYGDTAINLGSKLDDLNIALAVSARMNYILSDAIVVWRAWVLWKESECVKRGLCLCMLGTFVGTVIECVWSLQSTFSGEVEMMKQTLAMTIPLLLTNVVATTLIAVQCWYYRRDVKGRLGLFTHTTTVEKAIVVLAESGLVICLVWIVNLVIKISAGADTFGIYGIIGVAYHSISGIYPTFIVLVIAIQKGAASDALFGCPSLTNTCLQKDGIVLKDSAYRTPEVDVPATDEDRR